MAQSRSENLKPYAGGWFSRLICIIRSIWYRCLGGYWDGHYWEVYWKGSGQRTGRCFTCGMNYQYIQRLRTKRITRVTIRETSAPLKFEIKEGQVIVNAIWNDIDKDWRECNLNE